MGGAGSGPEEGLVGSRASCFFVSCLEELARPLRRCFDTNRAHACCSRFVWHGCRNRHNFFDHVSFGLLARGRLAISFSARSNPPPLWALSSSMVAADHGLVVAGAS